METDRMSFLLCIAATYREEKETKYIGFEVLTVVVMKMKIAIFWDIVSCSLYVYTALYPRRWKFSFLKQYSSAKENSS
jgi:hypothetical protein